MKELIAEAWKAVTDLRHSAQAIEAIVAKVEKALAEARTEVDALEPKLQALERVNKELTEKTQLLAETDKRLEAAQVKINKIKESL